MQEVWLGISAKLGPDEAWQGQAARAIAQAAAALTVPVRQVESAEAGAKLAAAGRSPRAVLWCPLSFDGAAIDLDPQADDSQVDYLRLVQRCGQVAALRQDVEQGHLIVSGGAVSVNPLPPGSIALSVWPGQGDSPPRRFWLPIALTAKGPLYCEAIGGTPIPANPAADPTQDFSEDSGPARWAYHQPLHFVDRDRQPLYRFGFDLLRSLAATPAVYLVEFVLVEFAIEPSPTAPNSTPKLSPGHESAIARFERLWPFPAEPAIASIGLQTPDLFACHVACLTGQPLREIAILEA